MLELRLSLEGLLFLLPPSTNFASSMVIRVYFLTSQKDLLLARGSQKCSLKIYLFFEQFYY